MPTSTFHHVHLVCHWVSELRPRSVLDVGVGFGKWGHLFREVLDISASGTDPARYDRPNWQARIDGIEGYPQYLTEMHRFLYNEIYVGDMCRVLPTLGKYDVIFAGDVIEHVEKAQGQQFLRDALDHANEAVVVSTPAYETQQGAAAGNDFEVHRSQWTARDFRRLGRCVTKVAQSRILVAMLLKDGIRTPRSPSRLKSFVRATLVRVLGEQRYNRLGGT